MYIFRMHSLDSWIVPQSDHVDQFVKDSFANTHPFFILFFLFQRVKGKRLLVVEAPLEAVILAVVASGRPKAHSHSSGQAVER